MRLRDALTLAWTKFRSRKLRTIVTSIITAVMLTILVGLSMAYTGVRSSIKDIDGLNSDRSLAIVQTIDLVYGEEGPGEELTDDVIRTTNQATTEYPGYEIINVYQDYNFFTTDGTGMKINGKEIQKSNNGQADFNFDGSGLISFNARSEALLKDSLFEGESMEVVDGVLPAFFDTKTLEIIEGVDYGNLSTDEKIKSVGDLVDKYKNKELVFSSGDGDSENRLTFRFVGLSPVDSIFEGAFGLSKGIYIPAEVLQGDVEVGIDDFLNDSSQFTGFTSPGEELIDDFDDSGDYQVSFISDGLRYSHPIFEFSSDDELIRFKSNNNCDGFSPSECTYVTIINDAVLEFDDQIGAIWRFLRYIVGFFFVIAAIFLFFTTSKIIGDSRKETGVFRAMGARRLDIAKIYAIYTLIITTVAYVLSILFATLLMLLINSKSADDLSEVATKATSSFGEAVDITFLGYHPKYLFYIWLVSIAVGLIGSALPIARNVAIDPIKAMRTE